MTKNDWSILMPVIFLYELWPSNPLSHPQLLFSMWVYSISETSCKFLFDLPLLVLYRTPDSVTSQTLGITGLIQSIAGKLISFRLFTWIVIIVEFQKPPWFYEKLIQLEILYWKTLKRNNFYKGDMTSYFQIYANPSSLSGGSRVPSVLISEVAQIS